MWRYIITAAALSATTVAAAAQSAECQLPYRYVGNTFSHKFHRPSCPFARQMWSRHICRFHFRHEAIDGGYTACNYCLPRVWLTVHARIIKPGESSTAEPTPSSIGF